MQYMLKGADAALRLLCSDGCVQTAGNLTHVPGAQSGDDTACSLITASDAVSCQLHSSTIVSSHVASDDTTTRSDLNSLHEEIVIMSTQLRQVFFKPHRFALAVFSQDSLMQHVDTQLSSTSLLLKSSFRSDISSLMLYLTSGSSAPS